MVKPVRNRRFRFPIADGNHAQVGAAIDDCRIYISVIACSQIQTAHHNVNASEDDVLYISAGLNQDGIAYFGRVYSGLDGFVIIGNVKYLCGAGMANEASSRRASRVIMLNEAVSSFSPF